MAENNVEAAPDTSTTETQDTGETGTEDGIEAQLAEFINPEGDEGLTEETTEGEEETTEGEEVEGEEKPDAEEKPEEEKEEPATWTVKVNGQEFDVNEQELVRGYQLGMAATQKFQEASKMRTQAEQVITLLQKDPLKILTNPALGLDFRKLAEEYLIEQMRMEQADPATKAQMMAEKKLAELQQREETMRKQQEEAEVTRIQSQVAQQIDTEFTKALANGKVPKTPTVVRRMAQLASELLDDGYDATADELVDMVRKEIIASQREIAGAMKPEDMEEFIGKDKMKAVRQADLAKAKKQTVSKQLKQFKPQPTTAPKRYTSERDLRDHIKKVIG